MPKWHGLFFLLKSISIIYYICDSKVLIVKEVFIMESKAIRFRKSDEKPMLGGFLRFNNERKEIYHIKVSFENEEPFIEGSIYNTSGLSKFLKTYIDNGSNNCTDNILDDIFNIVSRGCESAVIRPAGFEFTIAIRRVNNNGD